MKKRLLSGLLCLCMVLTLLPVPAWAAEPTTVTDAAGLETAISAGGEIKLDGDITVSPPLSVTQNVTLDLNGHAITATGLSTLFLVGQSGSAGTTTGQLAVTDSSTGTPRGSITGESKLFHVGQGSELSLGGGIVLTSNNANDTTAPALQNEFGTVNVLEGGFSITSEANNAIYNHGGTFNGNNISFSASTGSSGSGAALELAIGTVTGLNASVTNNRSDCAVEVESGSVEITGGSYPANGSPDGALYVGGTVTLKGGTFSNTSFLSKAISVGKSITYASLLGEGFGYTADNGATFLTDETDLKVATSLTVMAQSAQSSHTHAVSVGCETGSGDQVTFQALTSQDDALYVDGVAAAVNSTYKAYMLPAGNYYLAGDVRLDRQIRLTDQALGADQSNTTVNFCLNGYKLEYAGDHNYSPVIYVGTNAYALNICDCNPTGTDRTGNVIDDPVSGYTKVIWGGVITGGRYAGVTGGDAPVTLYGGTIAGNGWATGSISIYGGGVNADNFVMHGGAILYNMATYGGGVDTSDSFTMTGGIISDNWAARMNGGVHTVTNVDSGTSTSVTLSGSAKITGNVMGTLKTTPSNLNLVEGSVVTVAPEGLGEGFRVGISSVWNLPMTNSPVTVAQGSGGAALTAGDLAKFSSDNSSYELKLENGAIVLALPHAHSWATAWEKNDTYHWHKCTAAGCSITDYTNCAETGAAYGAHVYDDDQDAECNTCGYTRTITGSGSTQGTVDVKPGTPATTVDEESLKALVTETPAAGETITVKLTVEKKDESNADGAADIKGIAAGKTVEFLDLSLIKTVEGGTNPGNTPITDTQDKVLEIEVAYSFSGKKDVTVYRHHDGAAAALGKLGAKPAPEAREDGKFFADEGSGKLYIYASQFSTYAIGYTPDGGGNQPQLPPGGGGGYVPPTYAVELPASTPGGKVTASHKSASGGATVTLTLTPEEGYEIGGVTVTDQNGKTVAVTDKGDGKYTFTMPSRKVTVKAEFTKSKGGYADCPRDNSCPIWRFPDADPAAWYHDGVHYCVEHGLMSGYGGLFRPDDSLSRAEFVQVLHNLEGTPVVNYLMGFEDVPGGAWYAEAVRWAASRQIAGGYGNGRFGPNHSISREELAVMLWRYAGRPTATGKELNFADAEKASGWATEALCWAVDQGILRGKDGGILDPKGMTTRAEAAAVLQRVFCHGSPAKWR